MNAPDYPTPWQRKTLWSALTAAALVTIGTIAVGLIWLLSRVLGFVQPILIPFAIAGVTAYLLDPVVSRIIQLGNSQSPVLSRLFGWGTSRHRAVLAVFAVVTIMFAGVLVWVIPAISAQSVTFGSKVPRYVKTAHDGIVMFVEQASERYKVNLFRQPPKQETPPAPGTTPAPVPLGANGETLSLASPAQTQSPGTAEASPEIKLAPDVAETPEETPLDFGENATLPEAATLDQEFNLQQLLNPETLQRALMAVGRNTWNVIRSSVGGFLGVLGFLLSMIIVPVYLYYFLIEAPNISQSWGDYLPLRASAFKDEVISVLSEINGYLIAFFRGQLVVSLINGTATGIGLGIVGLDFGLLIGLLLCVLGIIPYLGIILCWIPAVIIASVQQGVGTWIPGDPWWLFPAVVTGIFVVVQQIDGLFITPKIVGESVGLHPMTVIVSVFLWSLLMGGLLGAILAVPLTATLKVLLKRYVWQRRFLNIAPGQLTEETFALQQALEGSAEPESNHAR